MSSKMPCKLSCIVSCTVLRRKPNRGGQGQVSQGEGEDQGTGGTQGAGAGRERAEEWERGCHAQCSALCAYRRRERGAE